MSSQVDCAVAILRSAGFRRGNQKRPSSRSRRWSRSAQTLFASWAVLGQLGGMGVLISEAVQPSVARADITDIPGARGGSNGTATSTGEGAFAIGIDASTANWLDSIAIGHAAKVVGGDVVNSGGAAVSIGNRAYAAGEDAIAIGNQANASAYRATAVGSGASANRIAATALGRDASATGLRSTALGSNAAASENRSVAIGRSSISSGIDAIALGTIANASANNSLAIGTAAVAAYANSAAIGQGAASTRANHMVLGVSATEITAPNLATGSTATDGSQFEMVVANGDGTLSLLEMEGVTIDPNNGTFTANTSVVTAGLNTEVTNSTTGSVTTYEVSGYNTTTQAGPITGGANNTSNGVTVSSLYNSSTQTTAYGVEVATGDGLTINDNGQVEINTGNGLTINGGQVEVNTGDNINIGSNGSVSGLKTTVSAEDRKVSVTASGGFDEDNNFTTNYEVGINITDRAFDALNCNGTGDGAECYGKDAKAEGVATTAIGSGSQSTAAGATTLGNAATASGSNSIALGRGAQATHNSATAIGAGSSTTRDNQILLGSTETEITAPNLSHDDDGKYHLVTADPDGTLQQQTFADAGFDIDITGEGALIKAGENVEVTSLEGEDENGYHGGLVTISAENVELQEGDNVSISGTKSGLTTTYTVSTPNTSVTAGTVTASGANETQLATTTANGATITGAWNSANSTSVFGVAVATGDGLTINGDGQVEINTGNGLTINGGQVEINGDNNIIVNPDGSFSAPNTSVAAGTVTASGANETQLDTSTSLGTTVTGVWNSDTSTNRFGVAVATGNGITIDGNGAIQANTSVVTAGLNMEVTNSTTGTVTTYEVSGMKTTISAEDRKVTVTATGGFDKANNYTTDYAIGINIPDRAFDALNCTGSGDGAECYGEGAIANQNATTAIGSGSKSTAIGATTLGNAAIASGPNAIAIGRGAQARHNSSTAIGAGARTTRASQMMVGTNKTEVTVPNLGGEGTAVVAANEDGTLRRTSVSVADLNDAIGTRLPDVENKVNNLEDAANALGDAAEAAGAMGAALSGIPEISLLPEEPVRCGFAVGGHGSQYAIAGGCAARVMERVHLNGAIAYSPSVDYHYGSTSSIAGRVGVSFPLGVKSNNNAPAEPSGQDWMDTTTGEERSASSDTAPPVQALWYRTEVTDTIAQLQSDVSSRDKQIDNLKSKLDLLIEQQKQANPHSQAAEPTSDLIAMLQQRIDELEEEKHQSALEDDKQNAQINKQNAQINELKEKLATQETRFEAMMKKLQSFLPKDKKHNSTK